MSVCDFNNAITLIDETDCLFDSLPTINSNFNNLSDIVCSLKTRVDEIKMIRTFFYYGPNAQNVAQSEMDPNEISRPSNNRIEDFVNSAQQLNLPTISEVGDIVYVVYQKTGYLNNRAAGPDITTQYRITGLQDIDTNNRFAPVFFIWQLICIEDNKNLVYKTTNNWPRIHRAETDGTALNWNQPQNWTTYNSWL